MFTLLATALGHADAHVDPHGVAPTPIPGLCVLRETRPSALQFAICKPMVVLVLQGRKHVAMGPRQFDFGAGESLLITTDVPTVSQITQASLLEPYVSLVIELDTTIIAGLVSEIGASPYAADSPVRVDPTRAEVSDTALRLLRLLERPSSLPILAGPLMRELHYWLLSGEHGGAIRALGAPGSHAQRIAKAVAVIRADYARPLRVDTLADAAGMSPSAFHAHFRAITSLTPLQFQKQLRLIEARRAMLAEATPLAHAAYAVGYESVPQFTREYARLFGQPPARDIKEARQRLQSAA